MNCAEFEDQLQSLFDHPVAVRLPMDARRRPVGTEPPAPVELQTASPAFREHAEECSACRWQWEHARVLAESIAVWREQTHEVQLPDSFPDSIVERYLLEKNSASSTAANSAQLADRRTGLLPRVPLASSAAARSSPATHHPSPATRRPGIARSRRALLGAMAGLAALLMVTVKAPQNLDPFRRPGAVAPDSMAHANRRDEHNAAHQNPRNHDAAPQAVLNRDALNREAEVQALVRNAGSAYMALAQGAAGAMGEAVALVVPVEPPAASTNTGPLDMSLGGTFGDGLQGVRLENRFKPLGESLGTAFQFLWEAADSKDNSAT